VFEVEDQDGVVQAMVEVDGAHKPVTREEEKEEEEDEEGGGRGAEARGGGAGREALDPSPLPTELLLLARSSSSR
jgi:hypothetical protein